MHVEAIRNHLNISQRLRWQLSQRVIPPPLPPPPHDLVKFRNSYELFYNETMRNWLNLIEGYCLQLQIGGISLNQIISYFISYGILIFTITLSNYLLLGSHQKCELFYSNTLAIEIHICLPSLSTYDCLFLACRLHCN